MAALKNHMGLYNFDCPVCGEGLPVLVRAVPGSSRPTALRFEIDAKPVQDHAAKHLAEAS